MKIFIPGRKFENVQMLEVLAVGNLLRAIYLGIANYRKRNQIRVIDERGYLKIIDPCY